jgi:hypothetical protein
VEQDCRGRKSSPTGLSLKPCLQAGPGPDRVRDPVPKRELIMEIAALAGDERAHPAVRQVAFNKLAAFQETHPHLFWMPGQDEPREPEPGPPMWTDVPYASDVASAASAPPPPSGPPAWFTDLSGWDTTTKGNPTIVITESGKPDYRIVLFAHKRSPTFGWLRINTSPDIEVFSQTRYATRDEALRASLETLCAI